MSPHQDSNMKKTFINLILLSALVLTPNSLFLTPTFAQQSLPLAVYPAKQDIIIKAGVPASAQIQFRNQSDKPVFGNVRVVDFIINDKNGTPELVEKSPVPKYGAANWITSSYDVVTIPPNDFVSINLQIKVPANVTTCGKYALVYFEPNLNASGINNNPGGSAIAAKIGGIINLETSQANCVESATITNVEYNQFQEYGPVKVNYDIANAGNIHINPSGFIQLVNFLGEVVDQKSIKEDRIFPETIRVFNVELGTKWMAGKYKVNLKTGYGNGKLLTSTINIWVFPWRLAIVIIIALIIIFFIGRELFKKLIVKEEKLEEELDKNKQEIEILKEKLRNKRE